MALTAALARAHMMSGNSTKSASIAEQALVLAELAENMPVLVDALITRGTALSYIGRVHEGTALLKGAIDLAEAYDLPRAALRAVNNLLIILAMDDWQEGSRMQKEALEKAKRIGDHVWIIRFASWVALDLVDQGHFAEALDLLDQFDRAEMDPLWRNSFKFLADGVALLRGEPGAVEQAWETLSFWKDETNPQTAAIVQWNGVRVALWAGDFADAYGRALQIDHRILAFGDHLYLAAQAALWLGDTARVDALTEVLNGLPFRGRMIRGFNLLLSAGRTALNNQPDAAVTGFRELIELWEQVAKPINLAEVRALFAALVGQDHPEARAAAEAAYQFVSSSGASQLLELWAPGLPRPAAVAATR